MHAKVSETQPKEKKISAATKMKVTVDLENFVRFFFLFFPPPRRAGALPHPFKKNGGVVGENLGEGDKAALRRIQQRALHTRTSDDNAAVRVRKIAQ